MFWIFVIIKGSFLVLCSSLDLVLFLFVEGFLEVLCFFLLFFIVVTLVSFFMDFDGAVLFCVWVNGWIKLN